MEKEKEIVFEIKVYPEGGFVAKASGHPIFIEADTYEELKKKAHDAVLCHFEESQRPEIIRLLMDIDELLAV